MVRSLETSNNYRLIQIRHTAIAWAYINSVFFDESLLICKTFHVIQNTGRMNENEILWKDMKAIGQLQNSGARFYKALMLKLQKYDQSSSKKVKFAVVHREMKEAVLKIYINYGLRKYIEQIAIIGSCEQLEDYFYNNVVNYSLRVIKKHKSAPQIFTKN